MCVCVCVCICVCVRTTTALYPAHIQSVEIREWSGVKEMIVVYVIQNFHLAGHIVGFIDNMCSSAVVEWNPSDCKQLLSRHQRRWEEKTVGMFNIQVLNYERN